MRCAIHGPWQQAGMLGRAEEGRAHIEPAQDSAFRQAYARARGIAMQLAAREGPALHGTGTACAVYRGTKLGVSPAPLPCVHRGDSIICVDITNCHTAASGKETHQLNGFYGKFAWRDTLHVVSIPVRDFMALCLCPRFAERVECFGASSIVQACPTSSARPDGPLHRLHDSHTHDEQSSRPSRVAPVQSSPFRDPSNLRIIMDTGCADHILSDADAARTGQPRLNRASKARSFHGAGATSKCTETVKYSLPELGQAPEFWIMPECPPLSSVGRRCTA